MKLRFLLTLALFTVANTMTAADAAVVPGTVAADAATTTATSEASVSYLSRAKTFVTDIPSNIKNGYNNVVASEFVTNHKMAIAVVATAVIASAITCYVVRKANKNKKIN